MKAKIKLGCSLPCFADSGSGTPSTPVFLAIEQRDDRHSDQPNQDASHDAPTENQRTNRPVVLRSHIESGSPYQTIDSWIGSRLDVWEQRPAVRKRVQ
jgi:hypothetical protein